METVEAFRGEIGPLVAQVQQLLADVILSTDERPAGSRGAESALSGFREPLPERGCGAAQTLTDLLHWNTVAGANTAGPRCYHFVIGGATPAALGADLLATALDTVPYTWILSPLATEMERQALDWLKDLLGLPAAWHGVMVTGASMANFVCLAAARQWWGRQHGVDVSETGIAGLPRMPVLSSGFVHASTLKVLALLGVGRGGVERFERDGFGRIDLAAMGRRLDALDGAPAVVVVNAGEVNAGEFDPVADMVDLARQHNCWVHVDGAFGLFARLSPRTADLVAGAERADSATVDGHKWLNVPYDSGYAFVRDHSLLAESFRYSANYLPTENDARPTFGAIGPESSRRARCFAVWATLKAYGREGHARIVEHCLDIAAHFAGVVSRSADLELMNEPRLNIVSFRYNPGGLTDEALDDLNARLGAAVLDDGRFLVGTSRWGARTIFRPAFTNWRTRKTDVEALADVIRELGATLGRG
jgi:glutamate/tyrosine decarboxylase-like PLP-dependent enzyme